MKAMIIEILTSPGFSLATLLLGFFMGHRLAIGRDKRNDFNKAAAIFREAFLPEIVFLRHNAKVAGSNASDDVGGTLSFGHLHRHLRAFEVFRSYLSTKKKAGIDKAWQKYCRDPDNPEALCFGQYSCKPTENTPARKAEFKKIALERIEEILKYAAPLK